MMVLEYVQNTKDMKVSIVRGLSYGRAGSGKTTFVGSFPKPLVLSPVTEGGIVTLRRSSVDYLDILTYKDLLSALEELASMASKGTLRWQSLIFDSITIYCEQYINDLLHEVQQKKMRRVEWGQVDGHLRTITELAHKLPMNVWWVALEDFQKDEETGKILKGFPMLYGKRAAKIIASMDIVLYHEVIHTGANQPDMYRAYSRQYGLYEAKDRFGQLPNPMKNPTFAQLQKAIGI